MREDGTPTYHLASVVDDIDFGITHVVRGNDHRPNEELHRRLFVALGATPPEFVHHGLILGEDGKKLAKRAEGATVASLRDAGIPPEAVRRYLDELGLPRHDVHYDLPRIRRLAIEAIGALSDVELAERVGAPLELVPALRGARDLNEAREYAASILEEPRAGVGRRRPRPSSASASCSSAANGSADREGARPRAEGRRRRPANAPARPYRPRSRPGALGGRGRPPARRGPAEDRCGSMTPPPAG